MTSPPPAARAARIVLVSVPKSGTHLAARLLEGLGYTLRWRLMHEVAEGSHPSTWSRNLLEQPAGTCMVVHRLTRAAMPEELLRGGGPAAPVRLLLNVRDPRDVAVSALHHLARSLESPFPPPAPVLALAQSLAGRPAGEQLTALLEAPPEAAGALNPLRLFRELAWLLEHPAVLPVRFEALVGPRGGGTREAQRRETGRILAHLGIPSDPAGAEGLAEQLFDETSPTFRRGRVGEWRETFTPAQAAAFSGRHGDVLERYGYAHA